MSLNYDKTDFVGHWANIYIRSLNNTVYTAHCLGVYVWGTFFIATKEDDISTKETDKTLRRKTWNERSEANVQKVKTELSLASVWN